MVRSLWISQFLFFKALLEIAHGEQLIRCLLSDQLRAMQHSETGPWVSRPVFSTLLFLLRTG